MILWKMKMCLMTFHTNVRMAIFLQSLVGTNPIAVAAPGKNEDNFELDMATSVVASGKVNN